MSFFAGLISLFVLVDVFQDAGDAFTQKEWAQLAVGVFLALVSLVAYIAED